MMTFSFVARVAVGLAVCFTSVSSLSAQASVTIEVTDPRPMKASIDQLEQRLGFPIHYEDPRFEAADEISDITDQVQSARQKAANPTVRILVPKGGRLTLPPTSISREPGLTDALSVMTQLRVAHDAAGLAGRFAVQQVGSSIIVEPRAVRGAKGDWKATGSVLDVPITLPTGQRNAMEALQLLLAEVSQKVGLKVGIGRFPIHAFANTLVTIGADGESAKVVLLRLLGQLAQPNIAVAKPRMMFSYRLLYDPGVKYYLLSINAVQTSAAIEPTTNPETLPIAGESPYFVKVDNVK